MFSLQIVAHVAQSVEHLLGKEEVDGSIPFVSTTSCFRQAGTTRHHRHPPVNEET